LKNKNAATLGTSHIAVASGILGLERSWQDLSSGFAADFQESQAVSPFMKAFTGGFHRFITRLSDIM
jgi:hypothetical protein